MELCKDCKTAPATLPWTCCTVCFVHGAFERVCAPCAYRRQLETARDATKVAAQAYARLMCDGMEELPLGQKGGDAVLPLDEMLAVLIAPNRAALYVGGRVDEDLEVVVLIRGDGRRCTVPWAVFTPSGTCAPDFERFAVMDCGSTLAFGVYEAASDSLTEADYVPAATP